MSWIGSADDIRPSSGYSGDRHDQSKSRAERLEKGDFRADLYYRLNVIAIHLPPLRERKEDIEFLALHFLKKFATEYQRPIQNISPDAMAWLKEQEWRENVRELKNVLERAVLIASHSVLGFKILAPRGRRRPLRTRKSGKNPVCGKWNRGSFGRPG